MNRFRANYWSCGSVANWILRTFCKTDKPRAMTMEGWAEWKRNAQQTNRIAFWVADTGLNLVQDVIRWPLDVAESAVYQVRMRFIERRHVMRTGLPAGFYEYDTRLLHAMFTELVDFVEVEKAWMSVLWSDEDAVKYKLPWWAKRRLTRFGRWRCKQAGIDYLNWEISLKDTENGGHCVRQSDAASELLALYRWWTEVRPARVDPFADEAMVESAAKTLDGSDTPEDKEHRAQLAAAGFDLERQYADEDCEMMIRVVRISRSMWT